MPITKEQIDELLQRPDTLQAKSLLDDLKLELGAEGLSGDIKKQYEQWQVLLQFLALPLLPFEDVKELLSAHAVVAIQSEEIDLVDLLTQVLIPYQGTNIDNYKRELFEALEQSEEQLGDVQVRLPDNTLLSSTVGSWLTLHVAKVGRGRKKAAENLQYFAQEKSIAKLDAENRGALRKLLQLYNLLQPMPLDDERLFQLDDSDFWWGVDVPFQYQGLMVTEDDQVVDEATFVKLQREAVAAPTPTAPRPGVPRRALPTARPGAPGEPRVPVPPPAKVKFDIKVALEQHPTVGEIVLTDSPFVDEQGAPKQPTVRAWLQDYARVAGLDYHTLQEREAYFFESQNAKALSDPEKSKLRMVLQSFDDGRQLTFSENFMAIQFKTPRERVEGIRMQALFEQRMKPQPPASSPSDVRSR